MTQTQDPINPPPVVGYASWPVSSQDANHLQLISIFHYIYGGVVMLFSCLFLIHIFLGIATINDPNFLNGSTGAGAATQPPAPAFLGWVFLIMGSSCLLFGWTVGILSILSGRYISQRRRKLFSLIIAGINCLFVPLGTILSVFTFIVLQRQSVEALYRATPGNNAPRPY